MKRRVSVVVFARKSEILHWDLCIDADSDSKQGEPGKGMKNSLHFKKGGECLNECRVLKECGLLHRS